MGHLDGDLVVYEFDADTRQAKQAATLVTQISTSELAAAGLAAPARPSLPPHMDKLPARARLAALQEFISSFQYNHTPTNYFNLLKVCPSPVPAPVRPQRHLLGSSRLLGCCAALPRSCHRDAGAAPERPSLRC